MAPSIDGAEVAKHNTKESCWIVLDSKVYDVTSFLSQHPGGAVIVLKQGGTVSEDSFYYVYPDAVLCEIHYGIYENSSVGDY